MKRNIGLILFFLFSSALLIAQQTDAGKIKGRVFDVKNNSPIPFANIIIVGSTIGSVSDLDGNFVFYGVKPGFITLQISAIGFDTYFSEDIMITNAKELTLEVPLEEASESLEEVKITAATFQRNSESPISLRKVGLKDIERSPGGNRDISKVIQSFPGVGSTASFRNDLIVRGGGPNENTFYLDGVEIPNLNHFATQGASGGPVGIINVDFIREVNYYSAAFPASKGDALSSVLDFKQVDGNSEKAKFRTTIGASDFGLTVDGPLSDKTTAIFSVRRSYLQFLFSAIGLPFLPTYNDFQFKIRTRIDKKNELTFIGIGALDQFELNLNANKTEEQRYILKYLPVNEQWNYTVGAVYKHFGENGYDTWVISRNYLNNVNYKFKNNIEIDSNKILDYTSEEIENKLRYEHNYRLNEKSKFNYGFNLENARYTNSTYRKVYVRNSVFEQNYASVLEILKWGLFGQATQELFSRRLTLSLGVRSDANNYSVEMMNLLKQISPRFSSSYKIRRSLFFNFNIGRYHQLPPYTTMGFRDNASNLINKNNGLTYITANHIVAGFEYLPNAKQRITIEGFYKKYSKYPFSLTDSVSIASKGGDFGTFGDEAVRSISEGRSYGLELFYKAKFGDNTNLTVSYTLVRSEFNDLDANLKLLSSFTSTAWDNIHLFNVIATHKFKRNWSIGAKWRFVGGAPYTPFNANKSSYVAAWDASGRAYPDYSRFNELRLKAFHQLDVRIDKSWFFKKWSLMFYTDIQNLYSFKSDEPNRLTNEQDDGSIIIMNPTASYQDQRYLLRTIVSEGSGTLLPTFGIILEF